MVKGVKFLKPLSLGLEDPVVPEDPFYGSFMEFYLKNLKDFFSNCCPGEAELGSLVNDVAYNLRGYLIRFGFAFGLVYKTCETFFTKGFKGLIKGFPGIPEFFTDSGNKTAFMAVSPKHLILYLAPIMRLKESRLSEQIRPDIFGSFFHRTPSYL